MHSLEHEAVAAERHDDIRGERWTFPILIDQPLAALAGQFGWRANERDAARTDPERARRMPTDLGENGAQASFRCSITGMSARTFW